MKIKLEINVFMQFWNIEKTLNPVFKWCVASQLSVVIITTWLVTGLCVNIHTTGRLSECIGAVDSFRKEDFKDEK